MSFFRTLGTARQAMPREETRTVTIDGREVPLAIRAHPRARRLILRLAPEGGLRLTVPPRIARREVDAFLARHEGWAAERLARLPDVPVVEIGASLPIGGVPHRIVHSGSLRGLTRVEPSVAREGGAEGKGSETGGETGSEGESEERGAGPRIVVSGPEERAAARVRDYLKKEARAGLGPLVAQYAARIGRPVRRLAVKDTRSRWGSCTHDGALSFSWRLAMAPPFVLDALAAHEVAHLRHMDHGAGFWALARDLCPRTDEARAWLKREGAGLHAWRFE